jgi:hypothetical protein
LAVARGSGATIDYGIIDIHAHIGLWADPYTSVDRPKLEKILNRAGIEFSCISSTNSILYDVRQGNREVLAACRESSKLYGYVVVNPFHPDSLEDLKLLESEEKLIGVKIHPDIHQFPITTRYLKSALKKIPSAKSLVLTHAGGELSKPRDVLELARELPDITFIMSHFGMPVRNVPVTAWPGFIAVYDGLELASQYMLDNVYLDTAHNFIILPGCIERGVEMLGADRILFGTDIPTHVPDMLVTRIKVAEIGEMEKRKILRENALKLLKL